MTTDPARAAFAPPFRNGRETRPATYATVERNDAEAFAVDPVLRDPSSAV
ncbi:hypothetical protein [Natrinema salaciae]|nr:hypothetical protein [Natrinema salaciae]